MTGYIPPVQAHRADTAPVRLPVLQKTPILRGWALAGIPLIVLDVALVVWAWSL